MNEAAECRSTARNRAPVHLNLLACLYTMPRSLMQWRTAYLAHDRISVFGHAEHPHDRPFDLRVNARHQFHVRRSDCVIHLRKRHVPVSDSHITRLASRWTQMHDVEACGALRFLTSSCWNASESVAGLKPAGTAGLSQRSFPDASTASASSSGG